MIGPYDKFAVEWGYKPFPEATSFEAEKAKLDDIVARQVKDATLRFGDPTGTDPSAQTEDLGSDAVAATDFGLKNLDRVASYLVKATSKKGEDYELLRNMYQQLLAQRNRELGHVVALVRRLGRDQPLLRRRRQAVRPRPRRQAEGSRRLPPPERLPGPDPADRPGHHRPPRTGRRRRADRQRAGVAPPPARQRRPDQADGRADLEGAARGVQPARLPERPPRRDLGRAAGRDRRHRPLPPEPPAGPSWSR